MKKYIYQTPDKKKHTINLTGDDLQDVNNRLLWRALDEASTDADNNDLTRDIYDYAQGQTNEYVSDRLTEEDDTPVVNDYDDWVTEYLIDKYGEGSND